MLLREQAIKPCHALCFASKKKGHNVRSKTNQLIWIIGVFPLNQQHERKKHLFSATTKKTKTAWGGWLLCTQRATISLRLKINTVSDNRNLRQALINIMYKFHCLHIQSNVFHSCSTISQHPLPNIKFKITGPQWKDSGAVRHGRLPTTHTVITSWIVKYSVVLWLKLLCNFILAPLSQVA